MESDREVVVVRKLYMVRWNSKAVDLEVEVHVLSAAAERKWELVEEMPMGRRLPRWPPRRRKLPCWPPRRQKPLWNTAQG
jgi:hypothetical protein